MVTSHFLSGRHTHTQPWPVWHQREKTILYDCCSSHWLTDWCRRVVDLSESGSQGCCLLQISFGLVFLAITSIPDCSFWRDDHSFQQCFVTSITMRKGPQGPKCSRELRSNALPKPFHDLLCHLLPKVWTSILPSHGRSLFQRCLPPLDAWGAPFVKWL